MRATSSLPPGVGGVGDEALSFEEVTEPDRPEVDVEEAVVNLLEADVVPGEEGADEDPVSVPPDPAVVRDEPSLEVAWVGEGLKSAREGTR